MRDKTDAIACEKDRWPEVDQGVDAKPMIELIPGPSDALPCAGDSGSPAFAKLNNKTWLIGVPSTILLPEGAVAETEQEFCEKANIVRIVPFDIHAKWIQETAADSAIEWSHDLPD